MCGVDRVVDATGSWASLDFPGRVGDLDCESTACRYSRYKKNLIGMFLEKVNESQTLNKSKILLSYNMKVLLIAKWSKLKKKNNSFRRSMRVKHVKQFV